MYLGNRIQYEIHEIPVFGLLPGLLTDLASFRGSLSMMWEIRRLCFMGAACAALVTVLTTFIMFTQNVGIEYRFYTARIPSAGDFADADSHVLELQLERQKSISQFCKNNTQEPSQYLEDTYATIFLLDKLSNVANAKVQKVACTSWAAFFLTRALSGKHVEKPDLHNLEWLEEMGVGVLRYKPVDMVDRRLQDIKKFVFVRHPLTRLTSAFVNKMPKRSYQKKYSKRINKELNQTRSHSDMCNDTDIPITFRDFVRYLIAAQYRKDSFNKHWRPQATLLWPCEIHYDFVGKMETMQNDTKYIFRKLFHDSTLELPVLNDDASIHKNYQYKKPSREYYAELTPKELKDIIAVYSDDFELFGYSKSVPT